ncbi:MAG: PRC-barrel domain-containing protein [Burkholderiales bacterium]|nr:PRC-barrel domain-containing protein [Burkholderiales bacterium]
MAIDRQTSALQPGEFTTPRRVDYQPDLDYWEQDKKGPGPHIMSADTLQGDDVYNDTGDKLGELAHLMIDVPTGRIAYGVLSVGGFLGIGDKLFAIPWAALRLDPGQEAFRLNISKEKLEQAEGFDKDAWPRWADQRWAERIHAYYEASPYWR